MSDQIIAPTGKPEAFEGKEISLSLVFGNELG
jgi:hypothetical protein